MILPCLFVFILYRNNSEFQTVNCYFTDKQAIFFYFAFGTGRSSSFRKGFLPSRLYSEVFSHRNVCVIFFFVSFTISDPDLKIRSEVPQQREVNDLRDLIGCKPHVHHCLFSGFILIVNVL